MTKREVLNAIANGEMNDEIKLWAENEIGKMDKANEARKNKQSKKAAENAPLVDKVVAEILSEEFQTATQIGEKLGVTPQKATVLAKAAVKDGRAVAEDIKVTGKGMQKGYKLA